MESRRPSAQDRTGQGRQAVADEEDGGHAGTGASVLQLRGFSLFGGVRVTTSPVASWSGEDHDGEALPPAASEAATPDVAGTAALDGSGPAVDDAHAPTADETVPDDADAPTADAPVPA